MELFRAGRSAEGVRLTVASTDPDALGVDDARDAVLAAIARGHSRWRHAGISSGAKCPFKAEHETSSGEDPRAGLFLWAMFGCLFLITALNWLDLSPVHGTALQVGGAVLVGSLASAAAYLLMPVVEVSASTRVGQAGRAAIRIGLLIAGPAVGLLVKHLVEAYL